MIQYVLIDDTRDWWYIVLLVLFTLNPILISCRKPPKAVDLAGAPTCTSTTVQKHNNQDNNGNNNK